MKKIMKLNIAICDDNKLVLDSEKTLIEETLKEMGKSYQKCMAIRYGVFRCGNG